VEGVKQGTTLFSDARRRKKKREKEVGKKAQGMFVKAKG